jgi:uncharacterized protein
MARAPEAFFHPAKQGGRRLYLHHSPPHGQPARAALLYLHPWAEEMNKSRRMAALASRALADSGCAVLQVDLLGCGDSSGDFADASWEAWLADAHEAATWLHARHPQAPLWLWGLRAGALLATTLAHQLAGQGDRLPNLLLWHPTPLGKSTWQQFLRLKAAGQLADGGGKAILDAARAELAAGRSIDVAGYTVTPALVRGLEAATLTAPEASAKSSPTKRLVWLEVSSLVEPAASPVAATALPRWQDAGWATQLLAVPGPSFWQTAEIEDAPALLTATVEALAA